MLIYVFLVLGFVLLVYGANYLVEGASALARRLNVSDLVIGLTVVAFGTSCPELFVNLVSSIRGDTAIAIGNILGSNIANVLLILGISAIICPLAVSRGTVWKEIPLSLLAAVMLGILAGDRLIDGAAYSALTRIDGLVLLAFFVIFMYYSFSIAQQFDGLAVPAPGRPMTVTKAVLLVLGGLVGLTLGGHLIVDSAVKLAVRLGLSQSLVGLTIVAVGTSLPELATSVTAAYRKNVDIAVGNVVGSNIFNIFFILGISAVIKPLPFQPADQPDILAVISSGLILFAYMFTGKKSSVDRWEGILFVLLYVGYITYRVIYS
jgi:cation:H+ antiporter